MHDDVNTATVNARNAPNDLRLTMVMTVSNYTDRTVQNKNKET